MSLLAEIKRRKVVRVAVAYIGIGWLIVEVLSTILPTFEAPAWPSKAAVLVILAGFPLAIGLAWALEVTPEGIRREGRADGSENNRSGEAADPLPRSVAVVPFADLSRERDNEHFTDGLTEELLNALTRIPEVRVASRTSCFAFKGKDLPLGAIAEQLGVGHVIEGSVRKSLSRIRITAQLIDAASDSHLWSESYDRELDDIFAIQGDIAQQIAKALRVTIEPEDLLHPTTENARAYDFYLRGRGAFEAKGRNEVEYAVQMFTRATEVDTDFVKAWNGLALSCANQVIYQGLEHHLAAAERASLRALELAPNDPEVHATRGFVLIAQERYADAEEAFERSLAIDETTAAAYHYYARASFHEGRLDKALELFGKAATHDPDDGESVLLSAALLDKKGDDEGARRIAREGLARAQRYLRTNSHSQRAHYLGARAWLILGEREQAREWAKRALEIAPDDPSTSYNVACVYAHLGDVERAIESLQRSIASRSWIENDPDMDPLRDDPRFQAYLESLEP